SRKHLNLHSFPTRRSSDLNIELLQRDKKIQERLIEEKKQELASLKGDLKVMENLKQKDFEDYRKAYNKEIDQKVEEQTQNWLQRSEEHTSELQSRENLVCR